MLINLSRSPNTTEGRNMVTLSDGFIFDAAHTAASPRPRERKYSLGPLISALSALM